MSINTNLRTIKEAFKTFKGTKRRFEIIYEDENYILIDDYAHHPTQIKAVLTTIKKIWNNRLIAVFQPHIYIPVPNIFIRNLPNR